MIISIAGDIGGTKSWLVALQGDTNSEQQIVYESRYQSRNFENVDALLYQFLQDSNLTVDGIEQMVLAIPGPVTAGTVKLTNLDWRINPIELQQEFSVKRVRLINDFQAAALGTLSLKPDDYTTLNKAAKGDNGIRLVLGAGTGFGMAYLYNRDGGVVPIATEGGHIEFAPTGEREIALHGYFKKSYEHVSYERILSGAGLVDLFYFCAGRGEEDFPVTAEWVNRAATDEGNPIAEEAMRLFARIYGRFVGNMALAFRPGDGLYLTGGVTAKVGQWLDSKEFRDAYLDKGRMLDVVANTPLYLITNERVGVQGAITALGSDISV